MLVVSACHTPSKGQRTKVRESIDTRSSRISTKSNICRQNTERAFLGHCTRYRFVYELVLTDVDYLAVYFFLAVP